MSIQNKNAMAIWKFSYLILFKLGYNQFHNILRLLNVLPNFLFTTSETMGHYYLEA